MSRRSEQGEGTQLALDKAVREYIEATRYEGQTPSPQVHLLWLRMEQALASQSQAAQVEGVAVAIARAQGMHVGLCQQGMSRWDAMKRVRETFEKWYPSEYIIIKEMPDDRFY